MSNDEQILKLETIIELVQVLNQQSSFEEVLRIISVKAIYGVPQKLDNNLRWKNLKL